MKNFAFATACATVVSVAACGANVAVDGATTSTTGATGGTTTTTSTFVTGAGAAGSNGVGGFGGVGPGPSTTTTITVTSTAISSSSSSGLAGCDGVCAAMFPSAYKQFQVYELKDCGCSAGGPCNMACQSDCGSATMSPACQTCLMAEEQKGLSSVCTVKAATMDCASDPACKPFSTCGICCATQDQPC